jgi:DNA-binding Xre family transcriptional regulator
LLDAHADRTGTRLTYADLARETGLSKATIESIATRNTYNATLDCVAKLCEVLDCMPHEILELVRTEGDAD